MCCAVDRHLELGLQQRRCRLRDRARLLGAHRGLGPDTAASAVARASTWAIRTSGTVVGFLQRSASVTPMRSTSAGAVVHGAKVRMVGLSLRKDNWRQAT